MPCEETKKKQKIKVFKQIQDRNYTEKKSLKFVTSNRRFWLKFSHLVYKRISLSFSNGLVFFTSYHVDIVTLKCMLQRNAVGGMFLKLINQHNFPLHFRLESPQHLVVYFPLFSKKLLDLNPTIRKYPILSEINPFFFFSHSRSIMKFRYQLPSGVYLMLILFFTSEAKNLYINSQFYHSSGIYFEPISKIRLFSENYNFISYLDIL